MVKTETIYPKNVGAQLAMDFIMNNRHTWQLKKLKSWEPIWPNFEANGLDWDCCLAGSSKMAPRIFIFSIVLGSENLSYVKSIETHARAFLPLNISAVGSVRRLIKLIYSGNSI